MPNNINLKDKVWIHLGEPKLVEGRIVDIIDLGHLNEGHSPDRELYIIEIKTGIDDVYEVRTYDQISLTPGGPINLFKNLKTELLENKRFLKKVGVQIPVHHPDPLEQLVSEIHETLSNDSDDPTPEQINAALERATQKDKTIFNPTLKPKRPSKKRVFNRSKKNDSNNT